MAQVVERLVGHPAGQRAVAQHRHHPAIAALELEGTGQTVGVAQDGRGMAVLDPVVGRFAAVGITGQPIGLTQLGEVGAAPGDQLVHVGLVARVPEKDVTG